MSDPLLRKAMPYGDANFRSIRLEGSACVDKTRLIEVLERGRNQAFIVRPRRFGKTLSVNMLQAYYDEAAASQFDQVFSGTYIGAHRTPLASRFRVLHLDFSGIAASSLAAWERAFQDNVLYSLGDYFVRYPHPQQAEILDGHFENPAALLEGFFQLVSQSDLSVRLYVIIDEYDQFVNEALSEDRHCLEAVAAAQECLKMFFAALTSAAPRVAKHLFITGVTILPLESMALGGRLSFIDTTAPALAELYGFTESELREFIPQVLDLDRLTLDLEELIARMKTWYGGYRFSLQSPSAVFHPTMCFSYLEAWLRLGEETETLLDPNAGYCLTKLEKILRRGDEDVARQIVTKALRGEPIPLEEGLGALNLGVPAPWNRATLLSALFSFGYLTLGTGSARALVVPNRAAIIPYFEFFLKQVLQVKEPECVAAELEEAIRVLVAGDPKPLFDVIDHRFQAASGRHSCDRLKESDVQTLLMGAFNFSNAYVVKSEAELDGEAKGFADILAIPSAESRAETAYLIEVKCLPPKAASTEVKAEALVKAREQISRYEKADNVKCWPKVKRIVALFVGLKLETLEIY